MRYFPVFADLENARVLIVGGGEQAAQKVRLLARTPARITLVATDPVDELQALGRSGRIEIDPRPFTPGHLAGHRLVYAATGSLAGDQAVAEVAHAHGTPINVVDRPDLSSFITPAIVDRAPVTVAIGTEGTAPVIAREIKTRLESWLPANFGRLAERAQGLRAEVARLVPNARLRRRVWERLLQGPFRSAVLAGREGEADAALGAVIANAGEASQSTGRVALIGAGPGDPDLLTLKALQKLQEADVLVVDRLVNPKILDYARRDAERIFVGKTPRGPATSQAEINRILVREALEGKIVARLKGGDPFIFGRASEELAALEAAGIASEIVPGVTAAHACAASIQLPVTLREKVRQFSVVTGATAEGEPDLDWHGLACGRAAFAIYMGVNNAPLVRAKLIAAGADPETKVVIVENGTLPGERAFATTLADITDCIAGCGITGPAVIFVGLDWADAGLTPPKAVTHYARQKPRTSPYASQINQRLEVEL